MMSFFQPDGDRGGTPLDAEIQRLLNAELIPHSARMVLPQFQAVCEQKGVTRILSPNELKALKISFNAQFQGDVQGIQGLSIIPSCVIGAELPSRVSCLLLVVYQPLSRQVSGSALPEIVAPNQLGMHSVDSIFDDQNSNYHPTLRTEVLDSSAAGWVEFNTARNSVSDAGFIFSEYGYEEALLHLRRTQVDVAINAFGGGVAAPDSCTTPSVLLPFLMQHGFNLATNHTTVSPLLAQGSFTPIGIRSFNLHGSAFRASILAAPQLSESARSIIARVDYKGLLMVNVQGEISYHGLSGAPFLTITSVNDSVAHIDPASLTRISHLVPLRRFRLLNDGDERIDAVVEAISKLQPDIFDTPHTPRTFDELMG